MCNLQIPIFLARQQETSIGYPTRLKAEEGIYCYAKKRYTLLFLHLIGSILYTEKYILQLSRQGLFILIYARLYIYTAFLDKVV
jgi:hypothetical protein